MDWTKFFSGVLPYVQTFLEKFTEVTKAPTQPDPPDANPPAGTVAAPNEAIRALQQFMNEAQSRGLISFGAPLAVDGWNGPKTDAAIMLAIARMRQLAGTP